MRIYTLYAKPAVLYLIISMLYLHNVTAQTTVLFGTTAYGGTYNRGAIISFNPTSNSERVVYNFSGNPSDGAYPYSNLVYYAGNSLFYGTTYEGGSNNLGSIFTFNPATGSENMMWSFGTGTDGNSPYSNLVYDTTNGLFYGMTRLGGTDSVGVIYSFDPLSNTENVVWNFKKNTDGNKPHGSLIYDTNNKLYYGMTADGGKDNSGAIFSFNPSGNTESVVWSFGSGTDGTIPQGNLVYDANNGLFYGMTYLGGSIGYGAIISFDPVTNKDSVVWNFAAVTDDGFYPYGDLIYDTNNELFYGLTYGGGTLNHGAIISFDAAKNKDSVLWSFGQSNSFDGKSPEGNLVYNANNGLFYGMTGLGGDNSEGAIISFNTSINRDSLLWSFGNGSDGYNPFGSLVTYTGPTGINTAGTSYTPITVYPNPNNGIFNIQLQNVKQNTQLQIFNVLGERIYTGKLDSKTASINLSNNTAGLYFYIVTDENCNQIGNGKFILE